MDIKDPVKARMTLDEALAKGEISNETKQFMECAIKQNEMIDRIKKEDFIRVWPHYTEQERQTITEEAEKENFLLFVKILANPQQKVRRLVYPDKKIIIMASSIPSELDDLKAGTFLFIKEAQCWRLLLAFKKNEKVKLKELNIAHTTGLEAELSKLPSNKLPENYSETDIKNIVHLMPLHPIDGYDDISGKADYFQCLTSAQVTQMVNNFPNGVRVDWYDFHAGIPFFASIKEVWASKVEADILVGKVKRDEKPSLPTKTSKLDRRKSDESDALHTLAKYVLNGGKGWKAFMDMLEVDHTQDDPYEGYSDCTKIYVQGKNIHFTIKTENGTKKVKRSKVSLKYHFTSAKKS
jgi:hypothetical protein